MTKTQIREQLLHEFWNQSGISAYNCTHIRLYDYLWIQLRCYIVAEVETAIQNSLKS